MQRLKRDDTVLVITGKERGKQGQVREILPGGSKVIVQGLNMIKRHQKQQAQGTQAGIIEKESPIPVSNVKLICRACEKPSRIGYRVRTDGVKVRVCKACDADFD